MDRTTTDAAATANQVPGSRDRLAVERTDEGGGTTVTLTPGRATARTDFVPRSHQGCDRLGMSNVPARSNT